LICSPSGSGKTLIGELCAIYNILQEFGKSIYLVPFKALATEKYTQLKKKYSKFGINIELSIGDYDISDSKLENANLIITTYEKMDSILRNFHNKEWIHEISTIVIDEIHILADHDRGPRIESLIVRLNEFLHNPQIIGLSATIANSDFLNSWLKSLENDTVLIKSDKRPVPLNYEIIITQNKDSTIKKLIKKTLEKKGQILVFLNKRKSTQKQAIILKDLVKKYLGDSELKVCTNLEKKLKKIKGANVELQKSIKNGIAFHHAGLLSKERKIIEDYYRKRIIKVICCTTTLSAGINLPARIVILKDFRKYVTSGYYIKNFSGFYENGDGFSYFKPFSANEVFQMLGRAGRPGLDSVGYGILLVNNIDERLWIEDHYFSQYSDEKKSIPKYNNLFSGLNKINTLKEQVLLRIFEEQSISLEKLNNFFEKTFFWFGMKDKMTEQQIPIDQLLMIQKISPLNILKLHSNPKKVNNLQKHNFKIKLAKVKSSTILGYIKTNFGVFTCQFDLEIGIKCSCGFQNGISDNFTDQSFSFEFCDHITAFLLYLLRIPDTTFQKYVNDIVPRSIKNQYILNYLLEKGLIIIDENDNLSCTQFGKLIIKLYISPVSGVLIRQKLENKDINSYKDLIKEAYHILKLESRVKDFKLLDPVIEWTDEEPVEKILQRYSIMAGDLYSVRDNLERIVTFIGIIATFLSNQGSDLQDKMISIAEMAETLKIRLHYGIREELFDLVLRIENVGRIRARILYNVGYHTVASIAKENPYILNRKTGLGIRLCKKIIDGCNPKY
jgi:helicase